MIVNKIRRLAHQYGSVKTFKAYLEYPEQTTLKSIALRSELQSCGVSLIDCPHNGRKDVADKMMMSAPAPQNCLSFCCSQCVCASRHDGVGYRQPCAGDDYSDLR